MIALLLRIAFDVRLASHLGAWLAGAPELGPALERVCVREAPRCQLRSVHEGDRWMERTLGPGMGTRGSWGTVAAYTVRWLPFGWRSPWLLDVPILGAYAAARRAASPGCVRARACRGWIGMQRRARA